MVYCSLHLTYWRCSPQRSDAELPIIVGIKVGFRDCVTCLSRVHILVKTLVGAMVRHQYSSQEKAFELLFVELVY